MKSEERKRKKEKRGMFGRFPVLFFTFSLLPFLFSACNNFFHDLVPPDDNYITFFYVDHQIGNAVIGENSITVEVDRECSVDALVPRITVSERASILPLTPDYLKAAFPNTDFAHEAAAMYETGNLTSYVIDLIKRTPGFNVPAIDKRIDFSGPVNFIVIGGQGSTRQYTVRLVEDSGEPRLLSFGFSKYDNPELIRDAYTSLDEDKREIQSAALYPVDMSISYALVPSFKILGNRLVVDGVEIEPGETAIPFSPSGGIQNKTITVWRDGISVDYELTIVFTEDLYSNRSIIDFRFNKAENPTIAATAVGAIINNDNTGTITVQVFYSGAQPSVLTARILAPGVVSVGGVPQTGGVSTQDFSQALQYRVVSQNQMYARVYTVSVEFVNIASASPVITSFKFSSGLNLELINDSQAQISESAGVIMLTARYGGTQPPQTLIPEFNATGIVTVSGVVQSSGFSAQDFSRQIKYTVTNPENPLLTRDYWVQVSFSRDTSSDAAITAFGFYPDENSGLGEPLIGAISQGTITIYTLADFGITEKVMIPQFTSAGTVSVNDVPQSSGVSGLVFDAPILYTVVSANGLNRRDYTVIVRELKPLIYVDQNATGSNDGLTWQDAFTDLREACEAAAGLPAGIPKELWIAKGTYTPGPNTDYYFPVAPNTSYIGGFAGWESFKSQRNKTVNPVVISGDIPRGSVSELGRAAFYGSGLTNGNAIFEDLEFRDFMQGFIYIPIYTEWISGAEDTLLEVKGCDFSYISGYCVENLYGTVTLKNIRADNIDRLYSGVYSKGHNLVENIEIVSQMDSSLSAVVNNSISFRPASLGTVTVSNVTLQDCMGGIRIMSSTGDNQTVKIDNLKVKNIKGLSIVSGQIIQISNIDDVDISNVDIDGAECSTSLILILHIKRNVILENISVKNIAPPYKTYNGVTVGEPGIFMIYDTGYTTFNNCYFEASGTSPDRGSYICVYNPGGDINLNIKNTRFNFYGQNTNLSAIKSPRGFNLENVTFENIVSNPLLEIDGDYPFRIKREGSFYNGASLSDDTAFTELNSRTESSNGAILTGE